jgi:ketosteroid isomerase-like protein
MGNSTFEGYFARMPKENVELVLQAIRAWNSGGAEAIVVFYTEDVVWYPFPNAPAGSGGLHGHDGIREVMEGWTDVVEDFAVYTSESRDLGEKVLWLGEISGTIKGAGAPVHQPMGAVAWDFRDGKIGKASFFPSWEEALEAAGLRE